MFHSPLSGGCLHFLGEGCWPRSRPLAECPGLHLSPVGLVPKGHSGDTWRMIVDLSYPQGNSVNDLISFDLCSFLYPSVDDAVDFILSLGRYTQLVKIDLKNAYRVLPIHPLDRELRVSWRGHVYIDGCLPFGLRSAHKIFTAFADTILPGFSVIVACRTSFITLTTFGSPFSDEAQSFRDTTLRTLSGLGLLVSYPKLEGPHTSVTFLGIHIDTVRMMELRLPTDKLQRIKSLVAGW